MFAQPMQTTLCRFLLALIVISCCVTGSFTLAAIPVQAADFVPLKGRFAGVGADFSGNFTHIGNFQGVADLEARTAVWTAANGDTITNQTTSFVLFEEVTPGVFRYEQTLVITGGSATAAGLINLVTGAYDGVLTGTISRPNNN
ncbi:MAG: hypothetical protein DYG89_01220 [Caldilinea sp. CFX5]|nr:hypothetical protein [Caldilinea sp. CFX5]